MEIALDEFVSDYLAIDSDTTPTLDDIAEAYAERVVPENYPEEDYRRKVEEVIPQIQYYWPAGKRA